MAKLTYFEELIFGRREFKRPVDMQLLRVDFILCLFMFANNVLDILIPFMEATWYAIIEALCILIATPPFFYKLYIRIDCSSIRIPVKKFIFNTNIVIKNYIT
jgi:hypothetical protein